MSEHNQKCSLSFVEAVLRLHTLRATKHRTKIVPFNPRHFLGRFKAKDPPIRPWHSWITCCSPEPPPSGGSSMKVARPAPHSSQSLDIPLSRLPPLGKQPPPKKVRFEMTRSTNRMRAVHPGEVVREDYLLPLQLSVNALASALGVPATRIYNIVSAPRIKRRHGGASAPGIFAATLPHGWDCKRVMTLRFYQT